MYAQQPMYRMSAGVLSHVGVKSKSYLVTETIALGMCNCYPRDAMLEQVIAVIVCLSVCLSHAGIVSEQLNVGSRKQRHVIAQGLEFSDTNSRWWMTRHPPEICAQGDPPLSNTTISTNIRL